MTFDTTLNDTLSTLKRLRNQVNEAISCIETGDMVQMTDSEIENGRKKYGEHAIVVGNFVITPR